MAPPGPLVGQGLNWPDPRRVGMYHMAWEVPPFAELEELHKELLARGARIAGYSDRSATRCSWTRTATSWRPSGTARGPGTSPPPGDSGLPRLTR